MGELIFGSRTQAIAALRRAGVKRPAYKDFLTELGDGTFECSLREAAESLKVKRPKYPPRAHGSHRGRNGWAEVTIKSVCRELIFEGLSNQEIFPILQDQFGLPDDKTWYPAWYRAELRRKGELPPAFDPSNQDGSAIHVLED